MMKVLFLFFPLILLLVLGCKKQEEENPYFKSCVLDFYTDEPVRGVRFKVHQDFKDSKPSSGYFSLFGPSGKEAVVFTDHNGCFTSKKKSGGMIVSGPYDFMVVTEAPDFPESITINNCGKNDFYKISKRMDCNVAYLATRRYLTLRLNHIFAKYPDHFIQIANGYSGSFDYRSDQRIIAETRVGDDLILKINCLPDFQKAVKFAVYVQDVGRAEIKTIPIEEETAKEFFRTVDF